MSTITGESKSLRISNLAGGSPMCGRGSLLFLVLIEGHSRSGDAKNEKACEHVIWRTETSISSKLGMLVVNKCWLHVGCK